MKQKYMVRQVQEALQDQLSIGENRHKAKQAEATHAPAGIFSYRTFETYMKQGRVLPTGQRHNTNAGRWWPPGHMWKPICKTGLTGGRLLISCLPNEPHCVSSAAARQAIWQFSFPSGVGKIFSEAERKPPATMAFPKKTMRIFSPLPVPPACAATNWRRQNWSKSVKTQTEA